MSKAVVFTAAGSKKDTTLALDKAIFGTQPNAELIALAYRAYLANGRGANATTLTRAMVRGGGRKPWRQKGTGRARAGSIRIPHWRGGGVVFGNTGTENFQVNLTAKMKKQAIMSALSAQAADGKVVVLETFSPKDAKVKTTAATLSKLNLEGQLLLVVDKLTPEISRATRNLAGLEVVTANYLNVFTIMNSDHLIITRPALDALGVWLTGKEAAKTEAKS